MPKLPTFLKKLMEMLNNPSLSEIISWRGDGNSFQIHKVGQFADQVLPHYFKHNNMASFVRQLNMYGFNRPKDSDQHAYCHPNFKKGSVNSIRFIKRKKKQRHEDPSDSSFDKFQADFSSEIEKSQNNQKWIKECDKLKKINEDLMKENEILTKKLEEYQKIGNFIVKMQEKSEKVTNEKSPQDNGSLHKSTEGTQTNKQQNRNGQTQTKQKRCCVVILQGGPRKNQTQL